jgi:hypothetical protein
LIVFDTLQDSDFDVASTIDEEEDDEEEFTPQDFSGKSKSNPADVIVLEFGRPKTQG